MPPRFQAGCVVLLAMVLLLIAQVVSADVDEEALTLFMETWRDAKAPGGTWDGRTGDMDGDQQLEPEDAQQFLELLLAGGEALATLQTQMIIAAGEGIDTDIQDLGDQTYPPGTPPDHMSDVFLQIAPTTLNDPAVQAYVVDGDLMVVTYANGLQSGWIYTPPHKNEAVGTSVRPAGVPGGQVGTEGVVGSLTATFLHVLANDPRFSYDRPHLDHLKSALTTAGFAAGDIVEIQGDNCTVDTFKQLAGKGFVLVNTHGAGWEEKGVDHCLFVTGDVIDLPNELLPGSPYYADWKAGRIFPTASCIPGDSRLYWCVTERFFDTYYSPGDFPESIFYNGACQGLKNEAFASVFTAKGVSCYLAWTESQSQSIITGGKLFNAMKAGSDVAAGMAALTDAEKHETRFGDAYLRFRPDPSGGSSAIKGAAGELPSSALAITTPASPQVGDTTISYRLTAPAATRATFEVYWTHRSNKDPKVATVKSVSGGTLELMGTGFYRIKNVPPGDHSFVWNTGLDIPGERRADAQICMVYYPEPTDDSWAKSTEYFAVDNSAGGVDPDVADIYQLFEDWATAFNNLDADRMRACMHPNYKNMGMDREGGVDYLMSKLNEDPSYKLSFAVQSAVVTGSDADAQYKGALSGNDRVVEWDEPGLFPVLGFNSLVKEDGVWWFYGNQLTYTVDAVSTYMSVPMLGFLFPPRYGAQFIVQDPSDYVTGGSVSGPGLTTPETLEFTTSSIMRGWMADKTFGTSPVATPATYTFSVSTGGGPATPQANMEGFFSQAASGMTYTQGTKTFSWNTNANAVAYRISVFSDITFSNEVWSAGPKSTPDFAYSGPALTGTHYWVAIMQNADGNLSLTGASFSP